MKLIDVRRRSSREPRNQRVPGETVAKRFNPTPAFAIASVCACACFFLSSIHLHSYTFSPIIIVLQRCCVFSSLHFFIASVPRPRAPYSRIFFSARRVIKFSFPLNIIKRKYTAKTTTTSTGMLLYASILRFSAALFSIHLSSLYLGLFNEDFFQIFLSFDLIVSVGAEENRCYEITGDVEASLPNFHHQGTIVDVKMKIFSARRGEKSIVKFFSYLELISRT